MRYRIIHRTTYTYESPVTVCHYLARLAPRALPGQECPWHEIHIRPEPVERATRMDYFGNTTLYFEIAGAHSQLEVISRSLVEVTTPAVLDSLRSPPWESLRDACTSSLRPSVSAASELTYPSSLVPTGAAFADYARPSFPPGRPILDAVNDLNRRINEDFLFDPSATDIATPVTKVLQQRRGVCQDFAQVMIACVRSLGLPARYVSGYLETRPPPGQERMVGADASHAWVAVFVPGQGWLDFDPTNNVRPGERHITVATGRDYRDVSPLRGVTVGGASHSLKVSVDVAPM